MISKKEAIHFAKQAMESEIEKIKSIEFSFLITINGEVSKQKQIIFCIVTSSNIQEGEKEMLNEYFSEFVASVYEDGYLIDMIIINKNSDNHDDRRISLDYALITKKTDNDP